MTSASHAEGRQFDPGQVYFRSATAISTANIFVRAKLAGGGGGGCDVSLHKHIFQNTPSQDRIGDLQRVRLTS